MTLRFSLGSIVRPPGGPCMCVLAGEPDERVLCGWIEGGKVQTASLPLAVLQRVRPTGKDEQAYMQAFRDGGTVLAHYRAQGHQGGKR